MRLGYFLAAIILTLSISANAQIWWYVDTVIVAPVHPTNAQIPITVNGKMRSSTYGVSNSTIQTVGDSVFINVYLEYGHGSPLDDWSVLLSLDSLSVGNYQIKCVGYLITTTGTDVSEKGASFLVSKSFGNSELTAEEPFFVFYPNPTKDELHIDFQQNDQFYISIVNTQGQTVLWEFHSPCQGEPKITLPLMDLPDGVYFLEIFNQRIRNFRPFIIKK